MYCKELNKSFGNKQDMIKELILNKSTLISQKKSVIKHADGISTANVLLGAKEGALKANTPVLEDVNELKVTAIINTTNLMDSHNDVHFPNCWKKSLSENRSLMHLQEHEMKFDKIISDGNDLKAYTQTFTWKELGFDYEGTTEALVFDSVVKASRNAYMFKQYKNALVRNHSVGMYYVKLDLAANVEEDWGEEAKAVWDKYYPLIANKETADEVGYFWAVTESKAIEGSAVPVGSNWATPTLHNNKNIEAVNDTSKPEPSMDTQNESFTNILKHIKF